MNGTPRRRDAEKNAEKILKRNSLRLGVSAFIFALIGKE
jgi:hypothetical protein